MTRIDRNARPAAYTQADHLRMQGAIASQARRTTIVGHALLLRTAMVIAGLVGLVILLHKPAPEQTYELVHYGAGQRYVLDYDMSREDCAQAADSAVVSMTCEVAK